MKEQIESLKADSRITQIVHNSLDGKFDVQVVGLTTIDGFNLFQYQRKEGHIQEDKLAAIISSSLALSNSAIKVLANAPLNILLIESDSGQLLICRTVIKDIECALCMFTTNDMNIGAARHAILRLANDLSAIYA